MPAPSFFCRLTTFSIFLWLFAASVASLTRELSEEDTKLILHELFGIVEEGVNFHKKDLEKYSATN